MTHVTKTACLLDLIMVPTRAVWFTLSYPYVRRLQRQRNNLISFYHQELLDTFKTYDEVYDRILPYLHRNAEPLQLHTYFAMDKSLVTWRDRRIASIRSERKEGIADIDHRIDKILYFL